MAADPEVIAAVQKKYVHGDPQFPILFDNGVLRVFKNPCNEIFVQDVRSGAEIRINSLGYLRGGLKFTTKGRVEPTIVNNMIVWCVSPR